jgi:Skp family chaperone for outer membrane proteins
MNKTVIVLWLLVLPVTACLGQTVGSSQAPIKVVSIDIQRAIASSGASDFEALTKKFEPRRIELQNLNAEVENLKTQLKTQGNEMNDEARGSLLRSIETKQKSLRRSIEDAQEDFKRQQTEIAQRILQKMAPIIKEYVRENGLDAIIVPSFVGDHYTTELWPKGPLLMSGPLVDEHAALATKPESDITSGIIEAYNLASAAGLSAAQQGAGPQAQATGTSDGLSQVSSTLGYNPSPSSCSSVNQSVKAESRMATGPGSCSGEVDAWLTNVSTQKVTCTVIFHRKGVWDKSSKLAATLNPGEKLGGFLSPGGIWTCGADSPTALYICFPDEQDLSHSCNARVQWDGAPPPSQGIAQQQPQSGQPAPQEPCPYKGCTTH